MSANVGRSVADGVSAASACRESDAALRAEQATVRLGGREIWSDVSVSVSSGEFVALLGPNGAGKSTLLHAALGWQRLSAGSLSVLGQPPGRANARIGYLPQRRSFDESVRVRGVDLVQLGLEGSRWGVPLPARLAPSRRSLAERVAEAIALVGAESYAGRPIGELSGGEQQRLLIAQALVRRPQLLLLDEPLDSLDLPNQSAVVALVHRICRSEGVAVVLVAHDVNPLLPFLDRVIYLGARGAVEGPVDEVITGTALSALFGVPIEVLTASDGRLVVVGQPEPPALHSDRHAH
jgi:zinc/manganese transport system ATP-binding protein